MIYDRPSEATGNRIIATACTRLMCLWRTLHRCARSRQDIRTDTQPLEPCADRQHARSKTFKKFSESPFLNPRCIRGRGIWFYNTILEKLNLTKKEKANGKYHSSQELIYKKAGTFILIPYTNGVPDKSNSMLRRVLLIRYLRTKQPPRLT